MSASADPVQSPCSEKEENFKDDYYQNSFTPVVSIRSILLFMMATIVSSYGLNVLQWCKAAIAKSNSHSIDAPSFAVYDKIPDDGHLVHVLNVLQRLGYRRTSVDDEWNLLWAHQYPFLDMPRRMKNLQPQQIVNHWPGSGYITKKVHLSLTQLPFLPRAFKLPSQSASFLNYAQRNPEALFVQKDNDHRHIVIRTPSEVDLNSNDSFVQEFVKNPFLVDGYKFDIGVYVIITSVDPLRVYIYTGDVLFRYCPVKYYPFDPLVLDKYVVGDDYLPTWEVPSLTKYFQQFGGGMRAAFDAYVKDQSLDPSVVWAQVEDIIRNTVLAKESDISDLLRAYKTRNFFELMRFDLIIDENLQVHLLEANMSPNLSSAHFKQNALLYEQLLYSMFNLVGVGSPATRRLLSDRSSKAQAMITADKNLATNLNGCARLGCSNSCNLMGCSLCLPCLSGTEYDILRDTHREHLHRVDTKRIVPKPIVNPMNFDIEAEVQNMTKRNEWLTRWFYWKCQYDLSWCS